MSTKIQTIKGNIVNSRIGDIEVKRTKSLLIITQYVDNKPIEQININKSNIELVVIAALQMNFIDEFDKPILKPKQQ